MKEIGKRRKKKVKKMGYWDFVRCQRSDGSFYGTGGVCKKGKEVSAKVKDPRQTSNSSRRTKSKDSQSAKSVKDSRDAIKRDMKNLNVVRGLKNSYNTKGVAGESEPTLGADGDLKSVIKSRKVSL